MDAELRKAAMAAAATLTAIYEWVDRVDAAGGAKSIEGVAACNAMLNSLNKNRKRVDELVIAPLMKAIGE